MFEHLPPWWPLVAIPLINATVGWITNAIAIQMLFRPIDRVGFRFLGWQGVVPAHAERMATICVDLMTKRLLDMPRVFGRLEPGRFAAEVGPVLARRAERIAEQMIAARYPRLWETVPRRVRDLMKDRLRDEIPGAVAEVLTQVGEDLDEYLDVKGLVVDAFTSNRPLLNELFWRCGGAEFRFISRSGFGFGLLFGGIQAAIWSVFSPWWLLPAGGLFVGWATNWLALKMVFRPLEPRGVGPFKYQGLFLKRQPEVSAEYATFFAEEILTAEQLADRVLRGPASDEVFVIVDKVIREAIDEAAGPARPFVQLVVGTREWIDLKQKICNRIAHEVPGAVARAGHYGDEALGLETELRTNLEALAPADFEQILRPIFREDEALLIAVGAALGGVAGVLQVALFA